MLKPSTMKRYTVTIDDCCVEGTFTAVLIGVTMGDNFPSELHFDNGVRLTNCAAVTLEQAS